MERKQPKKVGEYDRPSNRSRTWSIIISIIVLIILIILAIIIF